MKNHQKISLAVIFLFFAHSLLAGGGWPQPRGWGFFKLSQWWLVADQHYSDAGKLDPNTTNGLFNTSLYAEYGLTDRLTGVAYVPFFSRAYFNNTISGTTGETLLPGEAINGLGDADLGLKYGLVVDRPVAVSATLTLGLPLGNSRGGSQGNLQTGDGEFNQILQVDAGSGFRLGKTAAYANVYAGLNHRSRGFSDEFRWGAEAGLTLGNDRLTAIFRLYAVESFKNGDLPSERSNSTSVFANNAEHLTFAPELALNLNAKWGVTVGYATALRGELIFAAPSYSVGVYYRLRRPNGA